MQHPHIHSEPSRGTAEQVQHRHNMQHQTPTRHPRLHHKDLIDTRHMEACTSVCGRAATTHLAASTTSTVRVSRRLPHNTIEARHTSHNTTEAGVQHAKQETAGSSPRVLNRIPMRCKAHPTPRRQVGSPLREMGLGWGGGGHRTQGAHNTHPANDINDTCTPHSPPHHHPTAHPPTNGACTRTRSRHAVRKKSAFG
jgi:hypothetical protein